MSTIARITPIVGSLYALLRNKLGLNVTTPLGAQELSCTVAPDRRLIVLGHTPVAGFERSFEVADEAAMLALHTLDSATLLAEPTFVAPGDSCLRADDPGWRWHCISGHGTTLADWERRPLAGALAGLATSGHTHAIAGVTGLQTALDGKQAASANLTTLATVASTDVGRSALTLATPAADTMLVAHADGTVTTEDMPSGGGSGGGYLGEVADLAALLASGAPLGATARIAGQRRLYTCIAIPSSVRSAWVWVQTINAAAFRHLRFRADYVENGYLSLFRLRYRQGDTWHPAAMSGNSSPSPLVATADTYYSDGYGIWMAFDSSTSTRWSSAGPADSHWIAIDLGAGNEIAPDAVGVITGGATSYPRDFAVEGSASGVWGGEQTVVYSTTGQTAWSSGVERIFEW